MFAFVCFDLSCLCVCFVFDLSWFCLCLFLTGLVLSLFVNLSCFDVFKSAFCFLAEPNHCTAWYLGSHNDSEVPTAPNCTTISEKGFKFQARHDGSS